jgi:hypothetical protein
MRLAVLGYGSIWTQRFDPSGRRTAYFNTTGVNVGAHVRHRARVYGVARFNGNCGFSPHFVERSLGSVFECSDLRNTNGENRVVFTRRHATWIEPDGFLVLLANHLPGWIDFESEWKARSVQLLALSQAGRTQEALVIVPAFGWVKGELGSFYLDPRGGAGGGPRFVRVPGV